MRFYNLDKTFSNTNAVNVELGKKIKCQLFDVHQIKAINAFKSTAKEKSFQGTSLSKILQWGLL